MEQREKKKIRRRRKRRKRNWIPCVFLVSK